MYFLCVFVVFVRERIPYTCRHVWVPECLHTCSLVDQLHEFSNTGRPSSQASRTQSADGLENVEAEESKPE